MLSSRHPVSTGQLTVGKLQDSTFASTHGLSVCTLCMVSQDIKYCQALER